MEVKELWAAGLSECFAGDFNQVSALFACDESFAEMGRDFVEIHALTAPDLPPDPHVDECLNGLKDEILAHFASFTS